LPLEVNGQAFEILTDVSSLDDISTSIVRFPSMALHHLMPSLSRIKPSDIVLDLGSHIGAFSLAAARLGATVFAVDASVRHCAMLAKSKERNQFANLHIKHAVLGRERGQIQFLHFGPYSRVLSETEADEIRKNGQSMMLEQTAAHFNLTRDAQVRGKTWKQSIESCPIEPLGPLLKELKIDRVDFLKIDIEGKEMDVLSSMCDFFKSSKPALVMFECFTPLLKESGYSRTDLTSFFQSLGYYLYLICENELMRFDSDSFQLSSVSDYLASLHPIEDALPAPDHLELSWLIEDLAASSSFDQKLNLGMELSFASKKLLNYPRTHNALDMLRNDDNEIVREAVAWWQA